MRGVILIVTILMPAITAWARVDIWCTFEGDQVTVNYRVVGEPNKVSAFALDITVDNGAKIKSISNLSSDYWVYPGSIQIVDGEVNDVGSPICDPNSPGALGGLDTNGITIEMGALHDPPGDAYLPSSGVLLKFRVDPIQDVSVIIRENAVRGGVVLTNPSLPLDPNITNCSFCFACFPCTYLTYKDWLALKKPNCWCGKLGTPQWPYQCDGDAAGDVQGLPKYRIYTNDFNILVGNWKKTDAQLPGNCPRGQ